jgi:hypothetical protein
MNNNTTHPTPHLNQISTADAGVVRGTPDWLRPRAASAGPPTASADTPANPLYPPQGPAPDGTDPAIAQQMAQETALEGERATGVQGEQVVWEARYSMRNFIGRLSLCALASLGLLCLLDWTWTHGHLHGGGAVAMAALGIVMGIVWLALLGRIIQARLSHFYQLTTRRLFVTTGLFRRRRDQMELIGIKDVFERQTLAQRWLGVGTVVVVSPNAELPTFYLTGVNDPKPVMDLIWHWARTEREGKTVQVENL